VKKGGNIRSRSEGKGKNHKPARRSKEGGKGVAITSEKGGEERRAPLCIDRKKRTDETSGSKRRKGKVRPLKDFPAAWQQEERKKGAAAGGGKGSTTVSVARERREKEESRFEYHLLRSQGKNWNIPIQSREERHKKKGGKGFDLYLPRIE